MNKLLQIKFEERTPEVVRKSFSQEELKLLDELVKKHLVNIYYGGKYLKTGVYQVPNLVYRQLLEKRQETAKPKEGMEEKEQISQPKEQEKQKKESKEKKEQKEFKKEETDPIKRLNKNGYLVLQSEADAREISKLLEDKIQQNQVTGIRGFDKKYYLVKNSFVLKFQSKIKSVLKSGPKQADKIAEALGIEEEAAIALLTVLREEGEIIEKRKGTFSLID
ncbi:MAG: hypothetical protein QW054_00290 [Candidatus Micrarchaeia archaeon]